MNRLLLRKQTKYSLAALCLFALTEVCALSTDKNQDIEIESDTVYLDDTQNVGIYTGNVIIIQGSILITGNKLTVYYTSENDLEKIIVEGEPATFKQLPDNSTVYDEAEALVMEYHENQSLIVLNNKARVKQGDRRLLAEHIEYDTERSQVRAKGSDQPSNENEDTRVKLIIPGKRTQGN